VELSQAVAFKWSGYYVLVESQVLALTQIVNPMYPFQTEGIPLTIRVGNEPSRARLGSARCGSVRGRARLGSFIKRAGNRGSARLVIGSRASSSGSRARIVMQSRILFIGNITLIIQQLHLILAVIHPTNEIYMYDASNNTE
jgi:hypothetical protein